MSVGGTTAYDAVDDAPELVGRAIEAARELGFELCVRPEIGRFLAVLAGGLPPGSLVGESGTGTGTGLAWMVSAAGADVRFVSYEIDPERAEAAQEVFRGHANVQIWCGDGSCLYDHAPFDLLVHDGGPGAGKQPDDEPVDPVVLLRPGGTMTIDDFEPATTWPPTFRDAPDRGRMHWYEHAALNCTEVRVAPDIAVLVARRLPAGA